MPSTQWKIDTSHSAMTFTARHMIIAKVRGTFGDWSGTMTIDDDDPVAAAIDVRIQAASLDTKEGKRDAHLRSADFFDAENHPEIVFTSTRSERLHGNAFRLTGDLTMRATTHEVVLDAEYIGKGVDAWGQERHAYSAKTSVDRTRWGLVWNAPLEAGGFLVSDTIDLEFDIEAVRAQAA